MSDEMHPNCDRISPLPVISWPKMLINASVGEISTIIG